MYIKKKLLAISVILAMAVSFSACSDTGSSSSSSSGGSANAENDKAAANVNNNDVAIEDISLSSEELEQLTKQELTFEPFIPDNGVQQDAVEGDSTGNNNAADNSGSQGGNSSGGSQSVNNSSNNDNQTGNNNNQAENNNTPAGNNNNQADNNDTPAGNNNNQSENNNNNSKPNGDTDDNIGDNNVNIPEQTGLSVITGTKAIMQAYWMDLSQFKDYVFDGEYLVATFKIKEDAADGIYPITIEWLDFTNWDAETVKFTGIDGAIVVGGDVDENKFNDGSEPQVMASNISGKVGDTVTISFNIKNNPGIVGNILRFGYNSDALEYVEGAEGADFNGHFQ